MQERRSRQTRRTAKSATCRSGALEFGPISSGSALARRPPSGLEWSARCSFKRHVTTTFQLMSTKNTPPWRSVSRWAGLRSDALAKVARRATESANECRPTRLLFAPVRSKAAPSAKKLPPIEIGLDEKGSASILRTKSDAACAGTLAGFLADRSRIRLSHAASSAQQSSSRTMTYG